MLKGCKKTNATAPLADFGIGDHVDGAVAGNICLIQRGVHEFFDKVANGQAGGGVGAVIYNSIPGEFNGGLGPLGNFLGIPTVSTRDVVGATLKSRLGRLAKIEFKARDYDYSDGTSMAVPHVSAVAALVWNQFPGCTANHIRNAPRQSALHLSASGTADYYTGNRLMQAKAASDDLAAHACLGTGSQCWSSTTSRQSA